MHNTKICGIVNKFKTYMTMIAQNNILEKITMTTADTFESKTNSSY